MKKYSIIIPCYNSKSTIIRCVNSCLNQTYDNFEIIIIDDGSIDDTYEICKKEFGENKKIRIYKKINGGVSSARNLGLSKVTGDSVVFLDSDDELTIDALGIYNTYDFDLVIGGLIEKNREDFYNQTPDYLEIYNTEEIIKYSFDKRRFPLLTIPVAKVFNFNKIKENNIIFDELLNYGEDTVFVIRYLKHCKNIVFINRNVYLNHTDNLNSLSRSKVDDIWNMLQKVLSEFEKTFKQFRSTKEYKDIYSYLYLRNIKLSLINYVKHQSYKEFCDEFREIIKDLNLDLIKYSSLTLKDKVFLYLINTKSKVLVFIMLKIVIKKY